MIKIVKTAITRMNLFSFFVIIAVLNAQPLPAQQKNGIEEKRKTIANVGDTLIKLSDHLHAIISNGEAGNIAVYENPDGLILVDDQWVELTPKIKAILATITS